MIYPIIDNVDADGNQLINWMAEIKRDTTEQNDWNRPGNLADFFPLYESWRFDWLDVAQLIRDADQQNGAGPGGHQGATTDSSAAGSTPTTGSSDKSLPEPATTDPTTWPKIHLTQRGAV